MNCTEFRKSLWNGEIIEIMMIEIMMHIAKFHLVSIKYLQISHIGNFWRSRPSLLRFYTKKHKYGVFWTIIKLLIILLVFEASQVEEGYYKINSTWKGRKQECFEFCYKNANKSECMCNPTLMYNKDFAILAGESSMI